MINKENLKKVLEGKLNPKIKKLALNALKNLYSSTSVHINSMLILKSLGVLRFNKFDGDYFIDFDYLNTLEEPLIDYYIGLFQFDGPFGISEDIISMTGVLNMMLDSGVLITSVEYLKRKRVQKLDRISRAKNINNFEDYDDFFLLDDD